MIAVVAIAAGLLVQPDCANLPSTSDLRILSGVEGSAVRLAAPSSYYPGCDEPGDPLTITVDWGAGTSSAGRIEPDREEPRRFTVAADHAYRRPVSRAQIVIRQRNDRTGVVREDRHYVADIAAAPPRISLRRHIRARPGARFSGRLATLTFAGDRTAAEVRVTVDWGDGARTPARLSRTGRRFVVRGRHRWRSRISRRSVIVRVRDEAGARTVSGRVRLPR